MTWGYEGRLQMFYRHWPPVRRLESTLEAHFPRDSFRLKLYLGALGSLHKKSLRIGKALPAFVCLRALVVEVKAR